MKKQINYKIVSLIFAVFVICFAIAFYAIATWQEPTTDPPGGNVSPPINTGLTSQIKSGALGVEGLFTADNSVYLATVGGNVGIGTSDPRAKLHIYGSPTGRIYKPRYEGLLVEANHGYIQIGGRGSGNGAAHLILTNNFPDTEALENKHWIINHMANSATWQNKFTIGYMESTEADWIPAEAEMFFTIDTTGNVGIGTIAPLSKLQISDGETGNTGAMSSAIRVWGGTLGTSAGSEIAVASFGFSNENNIALGIRGYRTYDGNNYANAAAVLSFDVDDTIREGGYITLRQGGNVGIGVLTPNWPLDIGGGNIHLRGGTRDWLIHNSGGFGLGREDGAVPGGWSWEFYINSSTGYVGIGTSGPNEKLDVAGQIHATGDICTDSGGGVCLTTASGFIPANYNGEESVEFPNGLILKQGYIEALVVGNTTPLEFEEDFPEGVTSFQVMADMSTYLNNISITYSDLTVSGVNIHGVDQSYPGPDGYSWQAWGY